MAVPAGYVYKDGAYWANADGSGPYGINSAGLAVPLWSGAQMVAVQTGDTSSGLLAETALFQCSFAPGLIRPGGLVWISYQIERTGGADTYQLRHRFGLGTPFTADAGLFQPASMAAGTVASVSYVQPFMRRTSTSLQKLAPGTVTNLSSFTGASSGAPRAPLTVPDMDANTNILTVSVSWTTGGIDTLTLGNVVCFIINP